jgi:hypothetical protein
MLHHLFVILDDLLIVDRIKYGLFTDAFDVCRTSHNHPSDFYTDPPREGDDESDDESDQDLDMNEIE